MAITEERMTRLLAASEDLLEALRAACVQARGAAQRAEASGEWENELRQLAIVSDPQLLLRQPIATLLSLEKEKEHWTSSRLKRNARRRGERTIRQLDSTNGDE